MCIEKQKNGHIGRKTMKRDLGGTQGQKTAQEASLILDWFPSPAPIPTGFPVLLIVTPAILSGFLLLAMMVPWGNQLRWMLAIFSK